jgi:hypothetical protein
VGRRGQIPRRPLSPGKRYAALQSRWHQLPKLDGENGPLLTPIVDHLFDGGFISFEGNGRVIVSPVAHAESLRRMGVDPAVPISIGAFSKGQRRYLEYHRENVLRFAVVRR